MTSPRFVPPPERYQPNRAPLDILSEFHHILKQRRSVRMFSDRPVDALVIEKLVEVAMTAPSGANKQPWRFVCVRDPSLKREIRLGAETEEREFYSRRASAEWLSDLAPLGTDSDKAFLEIAPWLIVVFKLAADDNGGRD